MSELIPKFISDKYKTGIFRGNFKAYSMFVDLSGFTAMTENLMKHKKDGAEVLTDVLNTVFNPLVKIIYSYDGMISTFAGDALTGIFIQKDRSCLNCALEINNFINNCGVIETKYGKFEIGAKIGLSFGNVRWGILGDRQLHTYFFCGEAVSGCANSEHYAETNTVVADKNFIDRTDLKEEFILENKDSFYKIDTSRINFSLKNYIKRKYLSALTKKDILPFISDNVINFKNKAEFREVASVFVLFPDNKPKKMNTFITAILETALKFGGYFNKVDFGDKGNIALIIFGAPVSFENNSERALNFALELKNDFTDNDFRAGMSSGTVYAGFMGGKERSEYTVIGDIVNLSSRLVMSAEPGSILVSENIVKENKINFDFIFEGEKTFKGKTGKIPVFSLKGKTPVTSSVFNGKMIGRYEELKRLKNFIQPLLKSQFAGFMYVYGEPGIGKSRLVHEFRKSSTSDNILSSVKWLFWPCEEILQKSFNPVIYFLKKYFGYSDENSHEVNKRNLELALTDLQNRLESLPQNKESLSSRKGINKIKSIIGGYLGLFWKDSIFSSLDAKDRYENFLYSVKELIKAESLIQPLIIEIEDIHLIDKESAGLICIISRNVEKYPFAFICTSRYGNSGEKFKVETDTDTKIEKIDLNFLNKNSTEEYCRSILGTELKLSNKLTDFVFNKSSGNPFFMEQLILDLRDQSLLFTDKKTEQISVKDESEKLIPSNIQAVVISRLDRLSDDIKNVIQTASVLGREFLIKVLSGVLKKRTDLHAKIQEIEKENIWSPLTEMNYIFRHALMRDSAYDMQLRSRQKKLHALTANIFIDLHKDKTEEYYKDIAYHFEKACNYKKTAYYLEKAADHSARNFKNDEAVSLYDRLLALPSGLLSEKHQLAILLKKAEVLDMLCEWNTSENIYKKCILIAKKINDRSLSAKSYLNLGGTYRLRSNYDKAMTYFKRSLNIYEEINDKIGICRVLNNIAIIHYFKSEYDTSMELSKRQYEISKELNDIVGINESMGNIGLIHSDVGNYEKALECFGILLKNAKENGSKFGEAAAEGNIGTIYENRGLYKEAMVCYNKQFELASIIGNKNLIGKTVNNIGIIHWRNGDFPGAIENFKISLEAALETGDRRSAGVASCNIGSMYHRKGDFKKALKYYEIDHKVAAELGDKRSECIVLRNKGKAYFGQGDNFLALQFYNEAIKIAEELKIDRSLYTFLLSKAEVLYEMEDYKSAKEFIDRADKLVTELKLYNSISNKIFLYARKIDNKLARNKKQKIANLEKLKVFLKKLADPAEKAYFSFEIALLLNELCIDQPEYKNNALELYKDLVTKTPDHEYVTNLKTLEAL
ncbi:TPA: hypothetical protein DCR49_05775 [Candidatus Delongbacteria bacterium]|nr:hypothetical protein [Candidatus Delongbacteria bacterium]